MKATKFVGTDLPLYHYLVNRNGNTNSQFRRKKIESLNEYIRFNDDLCSIGKEHLGHGIAVRMNGGRIELDFHVIVSYGVSISAVAENLVSSVKYKLEAFTSMEVEKITVFVEGVRVID